MSQPSHNLEPTYRGLIIPILRDVTIRLTQGAVYETWLANKTLYETLLSDCKEEVKKKFDEVNAVMKRIRAIRGVDSYDAFFVQSKTTKTMLITANFELYGAMVASLEKHGYLDKKNTYITERDFDRLEGKDSEIEPLAPE